MKTRNDCEIRTFINSESYLLLRRLAEQRDRSLADVLRKVIEVYLFGHTPELRQPQPVLSRHKPSSPLEDPG